MKFVAFVKISLGPSLNTLSQMLLNPRVGFLADVTILHVLKTLENQTFFEFSRGFKGETFTKNRLISFLNV